MFRASGFVIAAALLFARGASADDVTGLPPDLAAVPANAVAMVHVKIADLWKNDLFKDLRATIERAGPKAMAAFDARFVPAPSTIDRITVFAVMPEGGSNDAPFVGVVSCSKPFDRAAMLKSLLPMGKEAKVGSLAFFTDDEIDLGIRVIDDRTFAIAAAGIMRFWLENPGKGPNPLAAALKEAAGKRQVVLALNASVIPGEVVAELPESLQPLARARLAQISLDIGAEIRAHVQLQFADDAQARSGERAAREGVKMGHDALKELRKQFEQQLMPADNKGAAPITELPEAALALAALGAIQVGDEFLKDMPLKRDGDALAVSIAVPSKPYVSLLGMSGLSAGFAFPALRQARIGAMGSRNVNNMKQIMLAFHNYHDSYQALPGAAICDKNGKPLLSWRVAILPFIEQDALYRQFKLDEPWDSDHNKKLLPMMPRIYALPNVTKPGESVTHYRAFCNNGAALDLKKGVKFAAITDGLSNTAAVFEAADPTEWTKPDDFVYDAKKPLPKLGRSSPNGFWVAMCDGSVRFVKKSNEESVIRAIITRSGGEVYSIE